jgi:hypothetical protein
MYLQGLLPVKRAGVESEFPGAPTSLLAWIREVPFASFDGEKVHLSIGDMVTLGERSLEILPMEHPLRGPCLYYLGQSLFARFKSIGDITDLHTCIGRVREALGCSLGPHHPLYWSCRLLVEGVLCLLDTNDQSIPQSPAETMQTVTAQRSSQEEAHKIAPSASKVDIWRKVVDHTPPDSHERPLFLLFLVTSLRLRFGETFDTRDIDEVIDRAREAVDIIPRDSPDRPMYLMEVGISFSSRFDGFGETKDIDEAIAIEREVAEVTPRDDLVSIISANCSAVVSNGLGIPKTSTRQSRPSARQSSSHRVIVRIFQYVSTTLASRAQAVSISLVTP